MLGNPRPAMGDTSSTVPDPPWFAKPRLPKIPAITTINDHRQTIELPYMRYALIDDELMLLGTTDRTGAVYGDYLRAFPMPNLLLHLCLILVLRSHYVAYLSSPYLICMTGPFVSVYRTYLGSCTRLGPFAIY